jgi:hypothetical protein
MQLTRSRRRDRRHAFAKALILDGAYNAAYATRTLRRFLAVAVRWL